MQSYNTTSNSKSGPIGEIVQLVHSCRRQQVQLGDHVRELIVTLTEATNRMREWGGREAKGLDVLDVGPGQLPRQMAFFAVHNRVTGIDLDVIPSGWGPMPYLSMLRRNGPMRVVKTVGRKLLGFDRRFNREMARQLGLERLPGYRLMQRDATRSGLPEGTFDLVYSFDTFEHLPDPAAAL